MTEGKSEQAFAYSGYIVSFYYAIEELNQGTAQLTDTLVHIKNKYETQDSDDMNLSIEDKKELSDVMLGIRKLISLTYMKFRTLCIKIDEFKEGEDELMKLYEELIEKPVFSRKELETYVLNLNKLFMSGLGESEINKLAQIYDVLNKRQEVGESI